MKLITEVLKGVTCIRKPLRIDFESLGSGLICFVGKNGSGKTTSAEIPAVALWQTFPSRPDFYERFHGRDAYVEVEFEDRDRRYKARIQVDAEKRSTERYLFVDGKPVASKAADFKAEVKEHCGSLDAFLVGPFAAQNRRGNFLEKKPAERKEIIAEMLGLQRWTVKHERAKKRRASVEMELEKTRGAAGAIERELFAEGLDRRVALRRQFADLEAARKRLDSELGDLRETEAARRRELEDARAKEGEIRSLEQVYRAAHAEHQTLIGQAKAAEERIAAHNRDSQRRIADLHKLLDSDGEKRIRSGIENRRRDLEHRKTEYEKTVDEESVVASAKAELERLASERRTLDEAQEALRLLQVEVDRAESNLRAAQQALRIAEAARSREVEALSRQERLLGDVPCTAVDTWFKAAPARSIDDPSPEGHNLPGICPLLADARKARLRRRVEVEALELPERGSVVAAERALEASRIAFDKAQANAGHLPLQLQENQDAQAAAQRKIAQQALIDDAKRQLAIIERDLQSLDLEFDLALENFRSSQERIQGQIAEAEQTSREQEQRLVDESMHLQTSADAASERVASAKVALDNARAQSTDVSRAEANLNIAERARADLEKLIGANDREQATIGARLEILEARAMELDRFKAEIEQTNQRLEDLKLIEMATGRNGVQILEISAAGPGISRKINELLEVCYGTRFSVRFETLREKVTVPGEYAEDFDIKISDNGREDSAAGLSGGEQVWISAAISLGINIYNAERSPIRWETLWLDETAGALDAENARKYVSMLRRARELGGFHQILFVSHSPEVQSMADACVIFDKGEVSIDIAIAA